jgi:NAD(P)-dependent dehydrogenase (short-subunit alcohol dehydrogenase family)
VLPGLTETKLTQSTFDYARSKGSEGKLGALTLMKRPGRVEDIAAVAAFLASDDAAYIDGQLIAADGGISATHPFGRFVL